MDYRTKVAIFDSISLIWHKASKDVYFYTFTLPVSQFEGVPGLSKFKPGMDDKSVARKFSLCKNNLRNNYGFTSYIEVREIQSKNTQNIHFHLVTSVNLNPLDLSRYWGSFFGCPNNVNSVDKEIVIKGARSVSAYVSKYLSAEGNCRPIYTRKMARSSDVVVRPIILHSLPKLQTLGTFCHTTKEGFCIEGVNFRTAEVLDKFQFPIGSAKSPTELIDEETGEIITI